VDLTVALVVLLSALLHAVWNAFIKINADRLIAVTLLAVGAAALAASCLPFVAVPAAAAWPYLAVSIVLQTGYKLCLIRAYAHGDLGQVYPIARGTAPLLVLIVSVLVVGERLDPPTVVAVLVLTVGVTSLAFRGGRLPFRDDPRPVAYALATSAFIAAYMVVDGLGARLAGSPHGYAAWLFALDGLPMPVIAFWRRRGRTLVLARRHWRPGVAGGAMSLAAYWMVIWAMTRAPLAPVAALRETSVLFAALLSVMMLDETFGRWRLASTLLVLSGVVLLRL
jgi:drug/metabolite transporter (DMT)-like permease